MDTLAHPLLLLPPARVEEPLAWVGHIPFAMLLVELARPNLLVELGTHSGNSYNTFCQAVTHLGLPTRCYAVDTWSGDSQAGHYGPEVFEQLGTYQAAHYSHFSTLLRMTFDAAAERFEAASIDILHIDGLHTYDAVRHDFEVWLPKMSRRGVVLFHDTHARHDDFGVWRLWEELSTRFPSLEFAHSHGLGVLAVGDETPEPLMALMRQNTEGRARFAAIIERLGNGLLHEYQTLATKAETLRLNTQMAAQSRDAAIVIRRREEEVQALDGMARDLQKQVQFLAPELSKARKERDQLIQSLSETRKDRDQLLAERCELLESTTLTNSAPLTTMEQAYDTARKALEHERLENQRLHGDIARVNAVLDEVFHSSAWKLSAPLRVFGRLRQRLRKLLGVLSGMATRAGGWWPLLRKAARVWRRNGMTEIFGLAQNRVNLAPTVVAQPKVPPPLPETGLFPMRSGRPGVLFVSHEASRTGAPIFLLSLIAQLAKSLDAEIIILLGSGGELEPEFKNLGTTITLGNSSDVSPEIMSRLSKCNIRLIYSNTITNGLMQRRLKEIGSPILCHVHELAFSVDRYFNQEGIQQVLDTTTLFLAGSKAVADYLEQDKGLPSAKVEIAYPFVDVKRNRHIVDATRAPLDLPADAIVVGACGTIGWRKGSDLFIHVAHLALAQRHRALVFVWVGGPVASAEFGQLQHEAEMLGIAAHVIFTGPVKSHLPYLAQFDIFMLPSREDPFPLVALDAASLGIPVVCFARAGGTPELVEEDAGIVVPYLDITKMAASIGTLADNVELREQLGQRARDKVIERYDVSICAPRIKGIIDRYLLKYSQEPAREVSR